MATKSNGKKYKCPYCDYKNYRSKLIDHVDEEHEDMIPKGYTASRVVYNSINKKDHGTCMICHKETKWDDNKQRYDTLCKNPKCKKQYVEIVRSRMVHKYGTYNLLKDPNFQKKMLEGRSISGKYKFADGGYVGYVGSYEKKFLEFMDVFLHIKSYDIISPGPNIPYTYKGEEHVWITDFLYEPYNLVFDIKDGGNNPNTRDMKEYREKQLAKEKAITEYGDYNYIRLTDNKFEQLILLMMELKDKNDKKPIIRINESYIEQKTINENLETILTTNPFKNEMTLYHGTYVKLEIISPLSYNAGTKISGVRMSSFWSNNYNIARSFALYRLVESLDYFIAFKPDLLGFFVLPSQYKEIISKLKSKNLYIYKKILSKKFIGIGHSNYFDEYTIDVPVKPDNVYIERYNQFKDMIENIDVFPTDNMDEIKSIVKSNSKDMTTPNKLTPRVIVANDIKYFKSTVKQAKSLVNNNESYTQEEARIDDDKLPKFIYHISYINHDGETFEPRVYDNDNVKNGMERRVKRVCFSDSITRALYSIFPNGAYDADFYVHVPDSECKVYKTTTDDIYDSDITHELWIKEPVKMKCIGKIHVSGVSDKTHTIEVDKDKAGYGKKKYHETKWRWIEKYEEDKTLYESVNESHIISSKEDNNMVNEFVSNKVIDDFESKQDMYLSHFTKMGLNVSFIQIYKQEYPSLSHIRINSNTKGCVWIDDKKNLVAIINTEKKDDDYVWINAFEIFGKYKGHGLSKQILKYAIKEYEITHLSVNKNNEVAYQLYKKLGFKTYNTTEKMYFMRLKSLNESYIEESSTNRSLYHLSQSNLDGKTLQPRIPSNFLVKNGYEDGKTERVCFAKSIDGSLRGLTLKLKGMKLYVHIPDGNYNIYNPTTKQVPDCKITSEVWIKEPVKLKCIGQIEVIKDKGEDGFPYKYGNNTAELYDWDWKWIDKINESSNILTQRINESADKSKLDKNFKKKSGIKFKYIDIKSNKSKVDKYLSEDKSYQNTYKKYLDDISGEIVIDEENDILAGYVFVIDKFITPVFVVRKYRGYGLGDALVKDAVSKYGAKRLWVYKDNEVAINLYKKYGFKTYIEDEEPSILMATDKKYAQDVKS